MAAPALELKPRQTVALFDAALRLCARSTGVWSLTLPAGAAVIAALFHLVDTIGQRRSLVWPVALFTAAWLFRAISMGAACHFLEAQVLKAEEPIAWRSFVAALRRTPSLIITAAFTAFLNALIWAFTLGVGFLFLGAHNVSYAVAMRGQGHPLAVYGTAAKLLGPTRHTAAWVRLCGLAQVLVALNLHIVVSALIYLGKSLLALDLTFAERFTSLDNASWVATVVATTFALFEPLRAATATLLLIDGRVRMEGLDLLSALDQLPRRRKPRAPIAAAVGLLLACLPLRANAQDDDWSGTYSPGHTEQPASNAQNLKDRLAEVVNDCGLGNRISPVEIDAVGQLSPSHQSALSRFVARVEHEAWQQEDCDRAGDELTKGLRLITQTRALDPADATSARDSAKAILARPEFSVTPPDDKNAAVEDGEEAPGWFSKWWKELWDAIFRWLRGLRRNEARQDFEAPTSSGFDMGISNGVVIVGVIAVIAVLAWLLLRGQLKRAPSGADTEVSSLSQSPLTSDPMSALARPPETWAGLADQLAADGKYREAIRHLYLALLSRLHRDGAIDYDPARSNWDYFRGFKGNSRILAPFRELTRRFDFAWYGNLEVSQAAWNTFRGVCEPILAPAPEEGQAKSA